MHYVVRFGREWKSRTRVCLCVRSALRLVRCGASCRTRTSHATTTTSHKTRWDFTPLTLVHHSSHVDTDFRLPLCQFQCCCVCSSCWTLLCVGSLWRGDTEVFEAHRPASLRPGQTAFKEKEGTAGDAGTRYGSHQLTHPCVIHLFGKTNATSVCCVSAFYHAI